MQFSLVVWGPFRIVSLSRVTTIATTMLLLLVIGCCLPTPIMSSSFVVLQPHYPARRVSKPFANYEFSSTRWQQQQQQLQHLARFTTAKNPAFLDPVENDCWTSKWSLQRLLKELDDRGIRYPVTASRTDLERLLLQPQQDQQEINNPFQNTVNNTTNSDFHNNHQRSSSSSSSTFVTTTMDPGLEERLRKRRNRRRRYQRADMIMETPISSSSKNEFFPIHARSPSTTKKAASYWAHRTVVERIPQSARNVVDRGWRITKIVSRKARDWIAIDDDGVRDVSFQYLHQPKKQTQIPSSSSSTTSRIDDDSIHTVRVVEVITTKSDQKMAKNRVHHQYDIPSSEQNRQYVVRDVTSKTRHPRSRQRVVRTHRPMTPSTTVPYPPRSQTRASASPFAKQRTRTVRSTAEVEAKRGKPDYSTSSSSFTTETRHSNFVNATNNSHALLMLPPATDHATTPKEKYHSGSSHSIPKRPRSSPKTQSQSASHSSATTTPEKRIYSPYGRGSRIDDRDVVDRVGEFLADTADRLMWGKFDTDRNNKQSDAIKATSRRTRNQPTDRPQTTRTSKQQQQYRHWKDRLEERLDSMLGIHENGAFYNKWTQRYAQEKQQEEGTDAFAVARGRLRKSSRPEKFNAKPFWEEDGSLMSLLFGVGHKNGGKEFFSNHRLDLESGSVLTLLRIVFRFSVMVASYLCRWASTGGAIPQPVVVVGVAAVGIATRPRRRLSMMAITLLFMRVAGEAVHGYENKGWEDFDPEYNKGDVSNSPSRRRKDGNYDNDE
jgi:hypothetical protein